jgi:hypothetical protein
MPSRPTPKEAKSGTTSSTLLEKKINRGDRKHAGFPKTKSRRKLNNKRISGRPSRRGPTSSLLLLLPPS